MKFTVETVPFRRLLGMLAQAHPSRRRKYALVRLDASRERLRVQQDQLAAEIEALVWQDGRCTASLAKLIEGIEQCHERTVVVEIQDGSLRLGESLLPCVAEGPPVSIEPSSRIFFASDLGVVASAAVPELALATA